MQPSRRTGGKHVGQSQTTVQLVALCRNDTLGVLCIINDLAQQGHLKGVDATHIYGQQSKLLAGKMGVHKSYNLVGLGHC